MQALRVSIGAAALALAGCVTYQTVWLKDGATAVEKQKDLSQCEYEAAAATTSADTSFRSSLGQEIDRENRRVDLLRLCMRARGWSWSRERI